MKKYFTISEFAKLRNVHTNSLRYYERLGYLKPAFVDPKTKYRYYSTSQLLELDVIILCIQLEIPLKDLRAYEDEQGKLQSRRLLEDGKRLAEQRMLEIQKNIRKLESSLNYIDENRLYENEQGLYTRHIDRRFLFVGDACEDIKDIEKVESGYAKLHQTAGKRGIDLLLPSGVILQYVDGLPRYKLYFEAAGGDVADENLLSIPEADFLCFQTEMNADTILTEEVKRNYKGTTENTLFVVSNMLMNTYEVDSKLAEVQILALPDQVRD